MLGSAWWIEELYHRKRVLARENAALSRDLGRQNEALRVADRARSDFLANVSHDLRTPLASIKASVSGLLEPDVEWEAETMRGFLVLVNEEVDRLAAKVRNLLDMARIEAHALPAEKEPCDLAAIVASALERVEPLTRGWKIEVALPPDPLLIEADYAQIETVLVNLLENAVKYSLPGTTLSLRGETVSSSDPTVLGLRLGLPLGARPLPFGTTLVRFALRDEGPGVPPGEEARIFEKFYRAANGPSVRGTGLGLAICKAIIEGHAGAIGVRRLPGGGAEFWFALPRLDDPESTCDASDQHSGLTSDDRLPTT
jgi:two-component system sensor histidine kinase KdpD